MGSQIYDGANLAFHELYLINANTILMLEPGNQSIVELHVTEITSSEVCCENTRVLPHRAGEGTFLKRASLEPVLVETAREGRTVQAAIHKSHIDHIETETSLGEIAILEDAFVKPTR